MGRRHLGAPQTKVVYSYSCRVRFSAPKVEAAPEASLGSARPRRCRTHGSSRTSRSRCGSGGGRGPGQKRSSGSRASSPRWVQTSAADTSKSTRPLTLPPPPTPATRSTRSARATSWRSAGFRPSGGERDEDRQPQQQLQHRLHHVCEGAACPPCPASPRRGMRASPRSASPRPPLSRHSISTARPRVQAMLLIRYVSGVSLLPDASPAVPSNYDHAPRCRSTPGRSPRARRAVSLAAFGRRTQNVLVRAHSSK